MKNKKKGSINTIVLLFIFLVIVAIATHFIPSGSFAREVVNGRNCVVPGSYAVTEGKSIGIFDIFVAIPKGFTNGVALIFAFLAIGGAFSVISSTGAINSGIATMINKIGVKKGNIILILLFMVFSSMGAFLGMTDSAIPFIPVALSLAMALGYDPLVALGVTTLGAYAGSMAGPTNPNSTAICQGLAELPIYSGIELRLIIWGVLCVVTLAYVMRYAQKVKKDYSKSLVADVDISDLKFDLSSYEKEEFTLVHKLTLLALVVCMGMIIFGSSKLGWKYNEMSAAFIILSIVVAVIARLSSDDYVKAFVNGARGMVNSVLIISLAYGTSVILSESGILDTIVHWISQPLLVVPKQFSVAAVSVAVAAVNCLITSASGKAAVLMPIILPLGDLLDLEAQVMILCYQFGDVVTNVITPLSGFVLTCLGFAKVPFSKWLRFVAPLAAIWFVIGLVFMFLAVAIGYC